MLLKKINILFFFADGFDYLSDRLLIGLKLSDQYDVYEYTQNNIIYNKHDRKIDVHGKAFTLGGIVDENLQLIYAEDSEIQFDYFIFGSISGQLDLFEKFKNKLTQDNTILIDGCDSGAIVPFHGSTFIKTYYNFGFLFLRFNYFKREWTPGRMLFSKTPLYVSKFLESFLFKNARIFPISFSIPSKKIIKKPNEKLKLFPMHIVDNEVLNRVGYGDSKYLFDTEEEYYNDLRISKFGITTKRAGWDCMRHYEIAANGSVICFRDLHLKPPTCAPHGLMDGVNCISYKNFDDLMCKISSLTEEDYGSLVERSLNWICMNTSEKLAQSINLKVQDAFES